MRMGVGQEVGPRSLFQDPHIFAKPGTGLAAVVESAAETVERRIAINRSRAASGSAAERRKGVIDNILTNIACLVRAPDYEPGKRLAIATAKTKPTRYDESTLTRRLITDMLKALEADGLVLIHPAKFKQRLTTIEPTPALIGFVDAGNIGLADLRREAFGETIILSARGTAERRYGEPPPKDRIDYEDDDDSIRYRGEMLRINSYLNSASLTFDGVVQAPVALRRTFLLRTPGDRRTFTLNGRLVGGWWLSLPSRDRHRIRLNGEELADLDFKAMFIQLAYRRNGDALSEHFDPYAIPGLEGHRDGAKKAMLSLLGRASSMRKLSTDLKALLPDGWTSKRLVASARALHSDIAHLFGKDIGVELMFLESQILTAVLLRLADKNVPALPMHDGIMVPRSHRQIARQVMGEASREMLGGVPLPVIEKAIGAPAR